MKVGIVVSGILLIICAIIWHNFIPYLISHANSLAGPLGGSIVCDTNNENICMLQSFVKTAFELSTLGLGLIGILFVVYGGLTSNKNKGYEISIKTANPLTKILEDLFS